MEYHQAPLSMMTFSDLQGQFSCFFYIQYVGKYSAYYSSYETRLCGEWPIVVYKFNCRKTVPHKR